MTDPLSKRDINNSGRVYPTAEFIPGLFDVMLDDGREIHECTIGQLRQLQTQGCDLMPGRLLAERDVAAVIAALGRVT